MAQNPFSINPLAPEEEKNPMLAPQPIIGQPQQVNPMLNTNLAQQAMLGSQVPAGSVPAPTPVPVSQATPIGQGTVLAKPSVQDFNQAAAGAINIPNISQMANDFSQRFAGQTATPTPATPNQSLEEQEAIARFQQAMEKANSTPRPEPDILEQAFEASQPNVNIPANPGLPSYTASVAGGASGEVEPFQARPSVMPDVPSGTTPSFDPNKIYGTYQLPDFPVTPESPIRSTFTLPSGEVVMERESGERFTPTAEQLQSFNAEMQSVSQPTATGIGAGGDQGVVLGGFGRSPMSVEETRSMLQERFGAPSISAIQALPAGQGLGIPTDAQGRMITPSAAQPQAGVPADSANQLSPFEQASLARQARIGGTGSFEGDSAAREARLATRPDFMEAQRSDGGDGGSLTMAQANRLSGGNRDVARRMVELSKMGRDPITGEQVGGSEGMTAQELATLEKTLEQIKTERLRQEGMIGDMEADQLNLSKTQRDELNTELNDLRSILGQTKNVESVGEEAYGSVSALTAGFLSPLRFIGGTPAADLEGNIDILKSDAFIKNITEMRKASPTGGAVGNVSDKDLITLQSLQTSFMQKQSPSQLRANIDEYVKIRQEVARDAAEGFIGKYGEEAFKKYFGEKPSEPFGVRSKSDLISPQETGQQGQGLEALDDGTEIKITRKN